MSLEIESDDLFFWVCSYDIPFRPDEHGTLKSHFVAKSTATDREAVFILVKDRFQHLYKIGQVFDYSYDEDANEYSLNCMRHPSLIKQEFKLPQDMPADSHFLGPMLHVNMMRVLRAVQATLCDNDEVKSDALGSLHDYYQEHKSERLAPRIVALR